MRKIKYSDVIVGQKVKCNNKYVEVINVQHIPLEEGILVRIDYKDGNTKIGKGHVELTIE